MYLGRVVESGPTAEIYARPNHPYEEAPALREIAPGRVSACHLNDLAGQ
jgi:peptide/nickel transport system ATP-binding protein